MCHDESSCNDRCRWNNENVHWKCSSAGHGSRKAVPDGIFDADESLLKHANKVYLEYCTSDAHWANTEKWTRPDGGLLQFRGQVVVQSMLTDLVEKHGSMVKVPLLGSAPARPLRLLRARLAALGNLALPGRGWATGRPTTASGA